MIMSANESQHTVVLAFVHTDKKARWKPQLHEKVLLKIQPMPDAITEMTNKFIS